MDNDEIRIELDDYPEIITEYLFDLEIRNYSRRTIRTYRSVLKNFYEYLKNKESKDSLDVLVEFKHYIRYLKREKKVSQNYIYLVTVVIKKFFSFSGESALRGMQAPKRARSLPKSLSETEIKMLIEVPDEMGPNSSIGSAAVRVRNKLIMTLLYSSGLRVSELVNLKVESINLEDRTIHVRGKGNKDRVVLFDYNTKRLIDAFLENRTFESEYLFVNRNGNPLTTRYIQIMIKKYAQVAGINKKVTPHILRHSFATHLLKKGMDIRAIQKLLGHSNLTTTQIYTSVDMETLKTSYDRARLL